MNRKLIFSTYKIFNCVSRLGYTTPAENRVLTSIHHRFYSDQTLQQPKPSQPSDKLSKSLLHNVFNTVANDLSNPDFKLEPSYKVVKVAKNDHMWSCTYNAKWPEPKNFVAVGVTKQEASNKAALSAITWLKSLGKIAKDGRPITLNKEAVDAIKQGTVPKLTLDDETLQELGNITEIYNKEFVTHLSEIIDESEGLPLHQRNAHGQKMNARPRIYSEDTYYAREKVVLPIARFKSEFTELVRNNRVVIVKGEPGCGKSTRIPQYLLEDWARSELNQGKPFRVAVTQPRRIAAISLCDRVSHERDEKSGDIVGYQVRLKSNFNSSTGRILYCTTGILLRHLQTDLNLSQFTHVILDEAHERDVNTDLLMNLLRSSLDANQDLKIIVMSATIDTSLFSQYFNNAPILNIPGFTHPVKSHFLEQIPVKLYKTKKMCEGPYSPSVVHEDVVNVIKYIHKTKPEGAILCFLPGWDDISKLETLLPKNRGMAVLKLHSRLQDKDQHKIFTRAFPGVRKVILATNIAETSVTIDDVVYVVDTGIHKEQRFDSDRGIGCIDNRWISKSSMVQRKGRAGRVQPGESFHLYPKSTFNSFASFTDPEILRTSLTKIILDSKVYTNNMNAFDFIDNLPTPPPDNATARAVQELKNLQLLDNDENLTPLGGVLANFQLEPKLAKILVNAVVYKCVTPVLDIVTVFSSPTELFTNSLIEKQEIKSLKSKASAHSDHLAMMQVLETWLSLMEDDEEAAEQFCVRSKLAHYKFLTLLKLRKIHFDYINDGLHKSLPMADTYSDNDELVKAVLLSGARNLLKQQNFSIVRGRPKRGVFLVNSDNQNATLSPDSVNSKNKNLKSNLLVYFNEVRSAIRRTTIIRESSVISPLTALLFSDRKLIVKKNKEGKLVLKLEASNIEFITTEKEAMAICECRNVLESAHNFFIFQMTSGGECNNAVNEIWDSILVKLDSLLLKHKVE